MSSDKPDPEPASIASETENLQVPRGHARIPAVSLDTDLFYRTLVDQAPDAIVYADIGGMIRFWNHGAQRIFGYTASEALGKSLDIIIPEELRPRHWEAYRETIRTGRTRYGTGDVLSVPASRKDRTPVQIEFTLLPFHDPAGRVLGVAAILRDATRHFEETHALRKELASLRHGSRRNADSQG